MPIPIGDIGDRSAVVYPSHPKQVNNLLNILGTTLSGFFKTRDVNFYGRCGPVQ